MPHTSRRTGRFPPLDGARPLAAVREPPLRLPEEREAPLLAPDEVRFRVVAMVLPLVLYRMMWDCAGKRSAISRSKTAWWSRKRLRTNSTQSAVRINCLKSS